jgi:adenylate cyclase
MLSEKTKSRLGLALVVIASSGMLVGLRRTPAFAAMTELPVYDFLAIRVDPWETKPHPAITILTMSDEAFWRGLNDENLAGLIERIASEEPSVIAVDLIRDKALPPGSERLADLVTKPPGRTAILMASGIPGNCGMECFAPPPFLRDPDQISDHVGFAVMPVDSPGRPMVRRGLVAVQNGNWLSMPAQAAVNHLVFTHSGGLETILDRLAAISSLPPTAGGYAGGDTGGNQFLLKPSRNLGHRYPVIAAESVASMDPQQLALNFAGKIVFIGTGTNLAQDEKPVVGNPSLRGVTLLAAVTDQLLRELGSEEEPVAWASDHLEDGAILAAAVLSVIACAGMAGPTLLRIVTVVPVLSLLWLAAGAWALAKGIWFPVGAPIVATFVSGAATHALMFVRERRDRESMYALLEKYLSPEVAGAIWDNNQTLLQDLGPPPETLHATALFADLKGYSGITRRFEERSENREFIAWLNCYLRAVIPLVRKEHGFIQQFAGDGIFVIFGFPGNHAAAHPVQAVRCARDIAAVVAGLNSQSAGDLPPYYLRIGIYTGEIVCATVGDRKNASYSFFGSTINKAARLESLQKHEHKVEREPVRILISDPTRQVLGEEFTVLPFSDEPVQLDPNLASERVWRVI